MLTRCKWICLRITYVDDTNCLVDAFIGKNPASNGRLWVLLAKEGAFDRNEFAAWGFTQNMVETTLAKVEAG